ncbi:MAG: carbamoyltransferase HypF [Elusimicrobia bacterium]|nr:carbamoyltransferase HypF [Candidatus Obscuribacterium magneticum]
MSMLKINDRTTLTRLRLTLDGTAQGVGFRPFVHRLATELGLQGFVQNTAQGLVIEIDGTKDQLDLFCRRLKEEKPPLANFRIVMESRHVRMGARRGGRPYKQGAISHIPSVFEIRPSDEKGPKIAHIPPDVGVCKDCLHEIFDPLDRRYLYPFTNCTHCGPRYSIIETLPYDRKNTVMKIFEMCEDCRREYDDPKNRRFHAQPNACPRCGPRLEFYNEGGRVMGTHHSAMLLAGQMILQGRIVALKGLGGVHLVVDARNEKAVRRLRERKLREEKPLALMFPTLESVKMVCHVSALEEELLTSPAAPIVLLKRKTIEAAIPVVAPSVAPNNPYLGVMLPYTPLHAILMKPLGIPIVATSGNRSDEPICIDNEETLARLAGIADYFLLHNRPIVRQVDDSVVKVVAGRPLILRRSRGFAPEPVLLESELPPLLAVGPYLKNTVAVSAGKAVILSQHIGDLDNQESVTAFERSEKSLRSLYEVNPDVVVHDNHPDYFSTQYASRWGKRTIGVQHHHAHIVSCMADNGLTGPVLGVAWDGTGYGADGTVWGGEFLLADVKSFKRVGHFRTFRLLGGDKAVHEPRRSALGVLYEIYGEEIFKRGCNLDFDLRDLSFGFNEKELGVFSDMLGKSLNSPVTSSAGRLFDAVASLTGLRQINHYEGQAAMGLEFVLPEEPAEDIYPFAIRNDSYPYIFDWAPMILKIVEDIKAGCPKPIVSATFHNTLVEGLVAMAKKIGEERVVLSGGCFQNTYLTERSIKRLREENFKPFWHWRVPPNDGGLALGQAVVAAASFAAHAGIQAVNRLFKERSENWIRRGG